MTELLILRLVASLVMLYAYCRFLDWCNMHELTSREYRLMFVWGALAGAFGMFVLFELGCCLTGARPGTTSLLSTVVAFAWVTHLTLLYRSHHLREDGIRERLARRKRELQEERDRWGRTRYDPNEQ